MIGCRQIILMLAFLIALQSILSAEEPHKALGIGLTVGYQRFEVTYPELNQIGQTLKLDTAIGVRPEKNSYGGQIGLGLYGKFGRMVHFEPGFNILVGLNGGTRPISQDTSIQRTDSVFGIRTYGNEGFWGVTLAGDIGLKAGLPFVAGGWTLTPKVGAIGHLRYTGASEFMWQSYWWVSIPVGVSVMNTSGDHWQYGFDFFLDPMAYGMTRWAVNLFFAGAEGDPAELGKKLGYSGCLRLCRWGDRPGGFELTPYFAYVPYGDSKLAGRHGWLLGYGIEGADYYEPAGYTLDIGLRFAWYFGLRDRTKE